MYYDCNESIPFILFKSLKKYVFQFYNSKLVCDNVTELHDYIITCYQLTVTLNKCSLWFV